MCKYVSSQDHPVAKVIAGNWGDEPDFPYGHVPEEEAQANARLIAAAPDLLAACELEVMEIANLAKMVDPTATREYMTAVYAAIAKAKG